MSIKSLFSSLWHEKHEFLDELTKDVSEIITISGLRDTGMGKFLHKERNSYNTWCEIFSSLLFVKTWLLSKKDEGRLDVTRLFIIMSWIMILLWLPSVVNCCWLKSCNFPFCNSFITIYTSSLSDSLLCGLNRKMKWNKHDDDDVCRWWLFTHSINASSHTTTKFYFDHHDWDRRHPLLSPLLMIVIHILR